MCRSSSTASIKIVSESTPDPTADPQSEFLVTHEVLHLQSAPKGIFVDLAFSLTSSSPPTKHLRFQVDSGCSCNTIHVSDLEKISPVKIGPSAVRLVYYSKSVIPTQGQITLHCHHRGRSYEIVVQVITADRYFAPLLGLPESARMGILNFNIDSAHQI